MKLNNIFVLFALIVMAKGAWWAAATQPVILGLGALLGALNMDIFDAAEPFISKIFDGGADGDDDMNVPPLD